ncbi:MAG: thioredoxin-disulfide reductase [Elusimicrobia bacterium]|nr:thioredoxin-disulfide reductase [Elusimicrobiota bacterium]
MYDVIIIGGGPAGLTAGIYASRARLKTLLIDNYGVDGQAVITNLIENYPGFPEGINGAGLVLKLKTQAEKFGLEVVCSEVISIKLVDHHIEIKTEDKVYNTLSLIVASGAKPKLLGIYGEVEFKGNGVSYCATCDAAFFKNKVVAVIGGGDTAVEEALFLTKFASTVFIVHRRDSLRATKIIQERALANKKIKFLWNSKVIKIEGTKKVEGILIENVRTLERENVTCDGVFIFVGYNPNTNLLKDIVKLDESGYIITDEEMKTSIDSVFASGDCRKKSLKQIVTACSDGAIAAISAEKYLESLKDR